MHHLRNIFFTSTPQKLPTMSMIVSKHSIRQKKKKKSNFKTIVLPVKIFNNFKISRVSFLSKVFFWVKPIFEIISEIPD